MAAHPRRSRRGPVLVSPALTQTLAPNDAWSVDFKAWFRTLDGERAEPFTGRDQFSRYSIGIKLMADKNEPSVRKAMARWFRRYGLPRVIRVDNGPPFGGTGPRGLSRLSVWWLRLGIQVEFTRPARPIPRTTELQIVNRTALGSFLRGPSPGPFGR